MFISIRILIQLFIYKQNKSVIFQVKAVGQDCETLGNDECLLDFESATSHTIVVMVTDNGKPPMSNSFTLTVVVEDVNDPPRHLDIKVENLREDLPLDSKVATMEVIKEIMKMK